MKIWEFLRKISRHTTFTSTCRKAPVAAPFRRFVIGFGAARIVQPPTGPSTLYEAAGALWFQGTRWALLDRVTNTYASLDLMLTLVALSAVSMHGYVFWAGLAERRRKAALSASARPRSPTR